MVETDVGAYWGPRAESVDEAADRLARLVTALAAIDPALSGWRDGGRSKREALAQPTVTPDHADLVQRLLAGRNRQPDDNGVIESFGYAVHWWNGGPDGDRPAAKLSLRVAGTSDIGSNYVTLNFPDRNSGPSLYMLETASEILRTLVTNFNPDWAVWTNSDLRNLQKEPDSPTKDGRGYVLGKLLGHPAGWAIYLGDTDPVKVDAALLPETAKLERSGAGTFVTVGNDPAAPPVRDVLRVRQAMGYDVPDQVNDSGDVTAASANSAGPTATAGPQSESTKSAEATRPAAPPDSKTRPAPHPNHDSGKS